MHVELSLLLILMLIIATALGLYVTHLMKHSGWVNRVQTRSFSFPATQHLKLVINNDSGAIHIKSTSTGATSVQATEYAQGVGMDFGNTDVTCTQNRGTLEVNASPKNSSFFLGAEGIDLDVAVPVATDIEVHTDAGSIQIDGTYGAVVAETSSGSIIANNVLGQMSLHTRSGPVSATNTQGPVTLKTQIGEITVRQAKLEGPSLIQTGKGSIFFSGNLGQGGQYNFEASGGAVDITLPASAAFRLSTTDGSGPLTNGFGSTRVGRGESQAHVEVSTTGNPIIIRKEPAKR
jgi:DUF4097 and DUF4098 domain-containing protein YvlB